VAQLLRQVADPGGDPCHPLRKLAGFLYDGDVDEFDKNALARASGAADPVASVLLWRSATDIEAAEAAVRVLAVIAASDCVEEESKRRVAALLAADALSAAVALARVLWDGSSLEAHADAARLLESMLCNAGGARAAVAESEELVVELIRLVGPTDDEKEKKGDGGGLVLDRQAVAAGLSCLATAVRS
jgi:hypothetical protein